MPKPGDKYIIEIGEVYTPKDEGSTSPSFNIYRIEGFNSLVFDEFGLKKLEPYPGEEFDAKLKEAYNRGLEEKRLICVGSAYQDGLAEGRKEFHQYDYQAGLDKAWAAVKLLMGRDKQKEYNHEFDGLTAPEIISLFPVDEVVNRLEDALKAPTLRVGDEVQFESSEKRFVITEIDNGLISGFAADGSQFCDKNTARWKLTGRHFPIADLLKQMEAPDERN